MTPPDDPDRIFLMANDVAWTRPQLEALADGIGTVGPVESPNVRLLEDDEVISTLLVGLHDQLGPFVEHVRSDRARRVLAPFQDALSRHALDPDAELHRVTLTGIHHGVDAILFVESSEVPVVDRAVQHWPRGLELIGRYLEETAPDEAQRVEISWSDAADSWVVHEVERANGEVLPGPIFEKT